MTRTNARQLALQLSFAVSAGSDVGPDAFFDEDYFRALPAEDSLFTEIPGEKERAYINALVTGVRDHREELDDLIERETAAAQFNPKEKIERYIENDVNGFNLEEVLNPGELQLEDLCRELGLMEDD